MITIRAWNVRNDEERTYGPFEWVQVTYDELRISNEGEHLAFYEPNCQPIPGELTSSPDGWEFNDGFIASDWVIGSES